MTLPTLALSIRQPWADLIVRRLKDVENRTWPAPADLIGKQLLIHASSRASKSEEEAALHFASQRMRPEDFVKVYNQPRTRGGVIGVATLLVCVKNAASPWAEPGKYHWVLADARPIPFVPCPGQLRLFRVNPHYLAHLEAA